jgi:hypothetical protein
MTNYQTAFRGIDCPVIERETDRRRGDAWSRRYRFGEGASNRHDFAGEQRKLRLNEIGTAETA